jgi:hypothetical protein
MLAECQVAINFKGFYSKIRAELLIKKFLVSVKILNLKTTLQEIYFIS